MTTHTSPPSQFGYRSSTSRRSFPNLQHASLAPLSSRFPMDDEHIDDDYQPQILTPSELSGLKSAPATPGILSRGQSPTRKGKKKKEKKQQFAARFSHESYFPSDAPDTITKAKSSSALLGLPQHGSLNTRRHHKSKTVAHPPPNDDEWMHRAGLAIASETRVTKGQSWLSSRASSTSLVMTSTGEEYHHQSTTKVTTMSTGGQVIDEGGSEPPTPRYAGTPKQQSRQGSRQASRQGSRVTSRRGSRAGSRLELTGMTPLDSSKFSAALSRHAAQGSRGGYFDDVDTAVGAEPDFVDPDTTEDEGREEDGEVARLARQRSFGIGGMVDRLVGFTLFNVDEDTEGSGSAGAGHTTDDGGDDDGDNATARKHQRRRDLLERAASNSLVATRSGASRDPPPPPAPSGQQGQGSWQDAAWLLSVASRVLY